MIKLGENKHLDIQSYFMLRKTLDYATLLTGSPQMEKIWIIQKQDVVFS